MLLPSITIELFLSLHVPVFSSNTSFYSLVFLFHSWCLKAFKNKKESIFFDRYLRKPPSLVFKHFAFNLFLPIWSELYKLTFFKIRWIQLEEATRLLSDFVFRSFMKGMIHLFFASTSILINLDYSWVNISKTQMVILVFMVRNRTASLHWENRKHTLWLAIQDPMLLNHNLPFQCYFSLFSFMYTFRNSLHHLLFFVYTMYSLAPGT